MTTDLTFFQHGDEPDAARFAVGFGIAAIGGYIVRGFQLTPDLGALEVTVDAGNAAIVRRNYQSASPNIDPSETYDFGAHPIEMEQRTQLGLTDNAINHVWLDANITTRNEPQIIVNQDGAEPTSESLKIGEVDTSAATASEAKSEQWNLVTNDGTLTYPDEAALSEAAADLPAGTAIYDRTNDTIWRVA